MPIRILPKEKGRSFRNTRRENRLEELGRVDAEKAHTSRGKRNLSEEKNRIRSELKTGGRASKSPSDTVRNPSRPKKAGPSARSPRKKFFKSKTYGGGPDSGNIGKLNDMLSKHKKMPKVPGGTKTPSPEDLIIYKMPKKYPPKREMQPLKKGGSAKKPRPQGPHMWVRGDTRKKYAAGKVIKGAISGAKKIGQGLGSTAKKIGKGLGSAAKKIGKGMGSAAKKIARQKYSSGGVVMAGKKVGCQIK